MKEFAKYVNSIQKDFPRFAISAIEKIGEGDNSKAFLVNKEFIFRFPKSNASKTQMKREIPALPIIQSFLNLPIPDFKFISPHHTFVGYKIIEGTPLYGKLYQSLHKDIQDSIQQTIGKFLFKLHHIELSHLKGCNLEVMDPMEEYSDNFEQAQKIIYPNISKIKRKIIAGLFTAYLDDSENFKYSPAIIHNDFSKDHILFDIVNKEISGIIDFGDIAFGDPDYDFMYLLDELGEDFLSGIFKACKVFQKDRLMRKLYFFSLANKLQIILAETEVGDDAGLTKSYRTLGVWLKKWNRRIGKS